MPKNSKAAAEEEVEDEAVEEGFPDVLYHDKASALAAVTTNGYALMYASAALKDDRQVVLAAVENVGLALRWASPEAQLDKAVVLSALKANCFAMEHAAPQLRGDRGFVLPTVAKFGGSLAHTSPTMRGDKEIVLAAISAPVPATGTHPVSGGALFKYASEELKADKAFVMAVVAQGAFALQFAAAELRVREYHDAVWSFSAPFLDSLYGKKPNFYWRAAPEKSKRIVL
jgi:hypothetical protein